MKKCWLMSGKWWVCPAWHPPAEAATPPQPLARCEDAKRMLPALPRVQVKPPPPTRHEPKCSDVLRKLWRTHAHPGGSIPISAGPAGRKAGDAVRSWLLAASWLGVETSWSAGCAGRPRSWWGGIDSLLAPRNSRDRGGHPALFHPDGAQSASRLCGPHSRADANLPPLTPPLQGGENWADGSRAFFPLRPHPSPPLAGGHLQG
jgi:hypothetical protein